ncbi:sulfatase-like hydrolase/transferase [Marinoscillum sp. 108]|uniref:sulfatase-like hydrolase/transferase n=1 Tax=Marinoscillum sp. 108 TaxID=2653151 RepID=UPI0012EF88E3|nr:sulfatase-like hydrolase/transferase [Marinoscillum sp. 108]VXD14464.1 Arylsulfatase A-like enzyme [Marinoscillum sp. 108]
MKTRYMQSNARLPGSILLVLTMLFSSCQQEAQRSPNIVIILADDLGYGDISSYNPQSKIQTPAIDDLARQGVMFTDAHTNSSVCTPTRYGLLTGRYSWRTRLKESVLYGYDKALIPADRLTIAGLLQQQGYETAAIGKWHLGWNWANVDAGKDSIDYAQPITNGPTTAGFDYFYGIIGSLSMPPYVWVENDLPTMVPTRRTSSQKKQSIWLEGEIAEDFVHEEVLPEIQKEAVEYIHAHANKDKPFFLYLPLTSPHNPILPSPEYQGKSGLDNPYPDFVMMTDGVVSAVANALKEQGVFDNTILVFLSDNGCSNQADFEQLASKDHFPSYIYRGFKSDLYEGGHRVPFVVTWPDKLKPAKTDALVSTTDFLATFADLFSTSFPDNAGEDSYSFVSALGLTSEAPRRESIVMHSYDGSFAYRSGNYKALFTSGSGGWSFPRSGSDDVVGMPEVQLYDLKADPSEKTNIQSENPQLVNQLSKELTEIVRNGRSIPGLPQKNDGPENWKQLTWMNRENELPSTTGAGRENKVQ